jgi:hypothetical protein
VSVEADVEQTGHTGMQRFRGKRMQLTRGFRFRVETGRYSYSHPDSSSQAIAQVCSYLTMTELRNPRLVQEAVVDATCKNPVLRREVRSFGDLALPLMPELAKMLSFEVRSPLWPSVIGPSHMADPMFCGTLPVGLKRAISRSLLDNLCERLSTRDFKAHWLRAEIAWSDSLLMRLRGPAKRSLRRAGWNKKQKGSVELAALLDVPGIDALSFARLLSVADPISTTGEVSTLPLLDGKVRSVSRAERVQAFSEAIPDDLDALTNRGQVTVRREIERLADLASHRTREPTRTTQIILMRYCGKDAPRSFEQCAAVFGGARQSIAAVVDQARRACGASTDAPALDRLLALAQLQEGRPYDLVEADLRSLLGEQQSLAGAILFAKDFLDRPVSLKKLVYADTKRLLPIPVLAGRNSPTIIRLIEAIDQSCKSVGVASAAECCHVVSQATRDYVKSEMFRDAVEANPRLVWIEGFSDVAMTTSISNPICRVFMRCMAVAAGRPVALRELIDAARRGLNTLKREPFSVSEAVLVAVFKQLADIYGVHEDAGEYVASLPPVPGPDLFSARELELVADCSISPPEDLPLDFLVPCHDGKRRLIGQPPESLDVVPLEQSGKLKACTVIKLTLRQSSAKVARPSNRIVYLPSKFAAVICGPFRHRWKRWRDIHARENRLLGLAPVLTGLGLPDGSNFEIEFDVQERTYELSAIDGAIEN